EVSRLPRLQERIKVRGLETLTRLLRDSACQSRYFVGRRPTSERIFTKLSWLAPQAHERSYHFYSLPDQTAAPRRRFWLMRAHLRGKNHVKENRHRSYFFVSRSPGNDCSHAPVGRFSTSIVQGGPYRRGYRRTHRYDSKNDCGKWKRYHGSRSQPAERFNGSTGQRFNNPPLRRNRQYVFSCPGF